MESSKFAILGEDGSGKTCYLLGMYYEMSMDTANYMVVATDPVTDRILMKRCERLKDKSRGRDRFPDANDYVQEFNFNLWYNGENVLPFTLIDCLANCEMNLHKKFAKYIFEAETLFICIDGENLVGRDTRAKIRKVATKCSRNINPYLAELRRNKGSLPPIVIIVTKYDVCMNDTDADEIKEIVQNEKVFGALFQSKDIFIAVIPVSLGDTLMDDSYQGDLDPINIHNPILIGINFALRNRGKKHSEEYAKNINRINRELEAIDMIFVNGAWQNAHGRHRFWNRVQNVANYF